MIAGRLRRVVRGGRCPVVMSRMRMRAASARGVMEMLCIRRMCGEVRGEAQRRAARRKRE